MGHGGGGTTSGNGETKHKNTKVQRALKLLSCYRLAMLIFASSNAHHLRALLIAADTGTRAAS